MMAEWENVGKIQGEKGDKGDKGERGERGEKGEKGDNAVLSSGLNYVKLMGGTQIVHGLVTLEYFNNARLSNTFTFPEFENIEYSAVCTMREYTTTPTASELVPIRTSVHEVDSITVNLARFIGRTDFEEGDTATISIIIIGKGVV